MITPRVATIGAAAPAALLTLAFGLSAGGFYPGSTAIAVVALCVVLLLRATLVERPLDGLSPAGITALGALAAYAGWTLLSSTWSHAPARALVEFDRALLYLLVFAAATVFPWPAQRLRALLRALGAALLVIALVGLSSRLFPDATGHPWPTERLAEPLGYWNATGLIAGLGLLLALCLTVDTGEPPAVRVAAAAACPAFAAALYLTLSRGAIVATLLAVLFALALGRPRGLVPGLAAALPLTAAAVAVVVGADRLIGVGARDAATADQGRHVALMLLGCSVLAALLRGALLRLDARLAARPARRPWSRRTRLVAGAGIATACAIAVAAGGLPAQARDVYDRATRPEIVAGKPGRLFDPGSNGRVQIWGVALDSFAEHPLRGDGAGAFAIRWAADRPLALTARDGHSLYLETLAELGLPGFVLLAAVVAIGLVALWQRRAQDRMAWSAALALVAAWALHAGVDWDWEMPAVTSFAFAVLGAACARATPGPGIAPARIPRVAAGLAIAFVAATPVQIALSQRDVDRALRAFGRGDCTATIDASLSAIEKMGSRTEPFELIGYCDVRAGRARLGVQMLTAALERDPRNWELHYALALVRGAAGLDPRPAASAARRANPRERLTARAVRMFDTDRPARWRRAALAAPLILPVSAVRDGR